MAVPVLQTSATYDGSTTATSHNVTLPSSISAGDVLIISIGWSATVDATTPAGWTKLGYSDHNTTRRLVMFGKTASGGEGATQACAFSATTPIGASSYRFSGATLPQADIGNAHPFATSTAPGTAVTLAETKDDNVYLTSLIASSSITGTPTGYTAAQSEETFGSRYCQTVYKTSTENYFDKADAWTITSTDTAVSLSIAIPPSVSGGYGHVRGIDFPSRIIDGVSTVHKMSAQSLVRLSDGTLILLWQETVGDDATFQYSTDDGATWAEATGTKTDQHSSFVGMALHVDEDDTLWLAYSENATPVPRLYRGTFSGSTITWDSGYTFDTAGSTLIGHVDLKRVKIGTSDYLGIVYSGGSSIAYFVVIKRTSGGTYSVHKARTQIQATGTTQPTLGIDFHHTGDGLTVAGSAPHFYVALGMGGLDDLYYWRIAHSATDTWTVGTKRTITASDYGGDNTYNNMQMRMAYDGTRIVMVFRKLTTPYVSVFERDEADTTTTERTGMQVFGTYPIAAGMVISQTNQDIYIIAPDGTGITDTQLAYEKYDRAGDSWDGALTVIDDAPYGASVATAFSTIALVEDNAHMVYMDYRAGASNHRDFFYASPLTLPGPTGTIATTNADDTSAGTGESGVEGTISSAGGFDSSFDHSFDIAAEGADISAAAGESGVEGTIAVTEADDVSAASGHIPVVGTIAVTNADDVSAATGHLEVTGTIAVTNADDVSAAAGQVWFIGTIATTNADDVSAGAGQVWFIGTVAVTEADDVSAAVGVLKTAGTIAVTEEDDISAASGTLVYTGTIATTNADDTSAATATLSYIFTNPTYEETFPREREDYGLFRWGWGYPVGYTVLIESGVASTYPGVTSPSHTQLEAADAYFLGGHINVVTPAQKVILDAAGYTVP